MSRLLWFLIVSTLLVIPTFGSSVDVGINFSEGNAIFSYFFTFDENEGYNSFSFEKPRDAILVLARDSNGEFLRTSIAGDYFIVYPKSTLNQTFQIEFESHSAYTSIIENNLFSSYFSFNFEINKLSILADFSNIENQIESINPRDHVLVDEKNILFEFSNVDRETFLQVDFFPLGLEGELSSFTDSTYFYVLLSFLILLLIFLIFFLKNYLKFLKPKQNESSDVGDLKNQENLSENIDIEIPIEISETNSTKESLGVNPTKLFEEYLEKYLTENEREVVLVVRDNDGIAQNEILHHLPSLTKSNLSKIITKLNGKHVLSRIRVGKINKIYLGDKLKFSSEPTIENP